MRKLTLKLVEEVKEDAALADRFASADINGPRFKSVFAGKDVKIIVKVGVSAPDLILY